MCELEKVAFFQPMFLMLVLQTVATKIRSDKNINGIHNDNREIKISILADDIK